MPPRPQRDMQEIVGGVVAGLGSQQWGKKKAAAQAVVAMAEVGLLCQQRRVKRCRLGRARVPGLTWPCLHAARRGRGGERCPLTRLTLHTTPLLSPDGAHHVQLGQDVLGGAPTHAQALAKALLAESGGRLWEGKVRV